MYKQRFIFSSFPGLVERVYQSMKHQDINDIWIPDSLILLYLWAEPH